MTNFKKIVKKHDRIIAKILKYCDRVTKRAIKQLNKNAVNFKCEICGDLTPYECEGAEPNTCAMCMPIE